MATRKRGKPLEEWENALIKTMLARDMSPQDIQAYFTRPSRTVNHARVLEIRNGTRHAEVAPASDEELDAFLESWPFIDPSTGLHVEDDELVVKAREAMIAAVHTFNSGGLYFRTELFVVTSIIAWTYLLHAFYKREGIDYRYWSDGVVDTTANGAERYWELGKCLRDERCPLESGVVNNLAFLYELRHEIEHRSTSQIDEAMSAKLQACCINFNDAIKRLFGARLGLDRRLSVALQFATFEDEQTEGLIGADLPPTIEAMVEAFHDRLTEEEQKDPKFRYRVALVPIVSNNATTADRAMRVVKSDSPEAHDAEQVLLKEVERPKHRPSDIVAKVREAGYPDFTISDHTALWQQLDAKGPGKGYGVYVAPTWYWYDRWLDKVLTMLAAGWRR